MTENVLRIDHLSAGYGRVEVLRDVCIDIGKGEVVALLGPNGAGKTTTLRAISALARTRTGSISMGARTSPRCRPQCELAGDRPRPRGQGPVSQFDGGGTSSTRVPW